MPRRSNLEAAEERKQYVANKLRAIGFIEETGRDGFYRGLLQSTALQNNNNFRNFKLLIASNILINNARMKIVEGGNERELVDLISIKSELLKFYISSGIIEEDTIPNFCKAARSRSPFLYMPVELWRYMQDRGLWNPPKRGDTAWGFTVPDWEYTMHIIGTQAKRAASTNKTNAFSDIKKVQPLLWALGAHEEDTLMQYSEQIEDCIANTVIRKTDPWEKQFGDLFMHYLIGTPMYSKLVNRGPIESRVRDRNAFRVNMLQLRRLNNDRKNERPETPSYMVYYIHDLLGSVRKVPDSMELSSYVRFRIYHEQMDRFAASIYTKAMEWMIYNGYSKLFSRVTVLSRLTDDSLLARPRSVEKLVPNATYHNAQGKDFVRHALFGRMVMFTHSRANEMGYMHSRPIITRATAENAFKAPDDFVLMNVDHDTKDPGRSKTHSVNGPNYAGNIGFMINEMLRAIMELEDLELAKVAENQKAKRKEN